MYNEIQGQWSYQSGAAGTFTIPSGARVLQVVCHATTAGTLVIFGGPSIPVAAGEEKLLRFLHALCLPQPGVAANQQIVATGTDSIFIEYVRPGSSI